MASSSSRTPTRPPDPRTAAKSEPLKRILHPGQFERVLCSRCGGFVKLTDPKYARFTCQRCGRVVQRALNGIAELGARVGAEKKPVKKTIYCKLVNGVLVPCVPPKGA